MEKYIEMIKKEYQVRKSYAEKSKFINLLEDSLKDYGLNLKIDKHGECRNLIIGDPNNCELLLTAHYDTPPNAIFPIISLISSIFALIVSQIIMLAPIIIYWLIVPSLVSNLLVKNVPLILYLLIYTVALLIPLLYLYQLTYGYANKNNLNDNTSGVVTLLSIINKLDKHQLDKICFVFFDQEELGLIGSANFSKKYPHIKKDTLLINYDCVANGSEYLIVSKKLVRDSNDYNLLCDVSKNVYHKPFRLRKAINTPYMSDQLLFDKSIGIVAVHRLPWIGYYLNKIHTRADTVFQTENIIDITSLTISFIEAKFK